MPMITKKMVIKLLILPTNVNDTTLGPGWAENQKKTSINNVTTDQ